MMRALSIVLPLAAALLGCATSQPPSSMPRPARGPESATAAPWRPPSDRIAVVAEVGHPLPGVPTPTVAALGLPITHDGGRLAFTGVLAPGDADEAGESFVWSDGRLLWRAGEEPARRLSGVAPQLAIRGERYLVRAQIDGEEGVWTEVGELLRKGDPAPGFDTGTTAVFFRRPQMDADGDGYWISEVRHGPGKRRGRSRVLYRHAAGSETIEPVLRTGDPLGDLSISKRGGLELHWDLSPSGEHRIHVVNVTAPERGARQAVLADDRLVMVQREPAVAGSRWERFFQVAIDDAGNWLANADTDAGVDGDLVTVYNGAVVAHEGRELAGFPLRPPARPLAVALDHRRSFLLWSVGGVGEEIVVAFCDPSRPDTATVVLETRTGIDLDLDGREDARVERLSDIGHGHPLQGSTPTHLFVAVELERPGEPMHEAILSLPLPDCPPPETDAAAPAEE